VSKKHKKQSPWPTIITAACCAILLTVGIDVAAYYHFFHQQPKPDPCFSVEDETGIHKFCGAKSDPHE
jgi:hypothetical protein